MATAAAAAAARAEQAARARSAAAAARMASPPSSAETPATSSHLNSSRGAVDVAAQQLLDIFPEMGPDGALRRARAAGGSVNRAIEQYMADDGGNGGSEGGSAATGGAGWSGDADFDDSGDIQAAARQVADVFPDMDPERALRMAREAGGSASRAIEQYVASGGSGAEGGVAGGGGLSSPESELRRRR